ncbi:hypothetical protein NOX82_28465 [Pseudomonas citronellolis]|uniref:hypothetical protein n=1 Tax=Pseudomonas citronellolis TaxID=53408 RepID=UPI00211319D2|nr:hypothetical protein [Pseudomonas citronellolis]UUC49762.1 hypothetical protein NOX82_28465 [Pseudomonas citronellolis]
MTETHDPKVLAFRMQRLRKAPRNWTYWVAGFTAANGIFLIMHHDVVILAGLILPFAIPGAALHLVAAAILAAIAYASKTIPRILIVPLAVYIADTLFAFYVQSWAGLAMHLVVFAFIGFSFRGVRAIKALEAKQKSVDC